MATKVTQFMSTLLLLWVILALQAMAVTDDHDVLALQNLYKTLNSPPQLKEWKIVGGDPCEESWTGVICVGSSIVQIKLQNLDLSGILGFELMKLQSLKHLDLSSNNIHGAIPDNLPLNLTHLNLACNKFTKNIPYSITLIKQLRHLNLSHNGISGPLGDFFRSLENLSEMDLSHNKFTGALPSSLGLLTNLTKLFLENNYFTGSVMLLSNQMLSDLNIENNQFSGMLPNNFQNIMNLWVGGNMLLNKSENSSSMARYKVLTNPSAKAIQSSQFRNEIRHRKKWFDERAVMGFIFSMVLIMSVVALVTSKIARYRKKILQNSQSNSQTDEPPRYDCTECTFSCSTSEGLAQHLKVHRDLVIQCPILICPLKFKNKADMRNHYPVKHPGKDIPR